MILYLIDNYNILHVYNILSFGFLLIGLQSDAMLGNGPTYVLVRIDVLIKHAWLGNARLINEISNY